MFKKIAFIASYSLPLIIVLAYYLPNQPITWAGAFYVYVLVPLIDILIGKDRQNVVKEEFDKLLSDSYFDFLVFSHIYIQYAMLAWVSYVFVFDDLTTTQAVRLVISQGIYAGTIINVSHELGHRNTFWSKLHARFGLVSVAYHHFIVEHNKGHHVHVATPKDPATSKFGQTLYGFWFQSIIGSFLSAWEIEKQRLNKKRQGVLSFKNEVLMGVFFSIILFVTITLLFSIIKGAFAFEVLFFLLGQSAVAILLLEAVNYMEHYGIVRQEISPGKYERVNPLHSWNANHFYSNLLLFNLQRHSDHHAYASRPYQILRHFDESPQLPFGYPLMIVISLFPFLWFKVMNPRLKKWKENAYDASYIKKVVAQFV